MVIKYGITKNLYKKPDIRIGYTLHTSQVFKQ